MRQFFCILCESFIYQKDEIFCSYCFSKIKKENIKVREDRGFKHIYLFSWSTKNDSLCRKIVYSLKKKPSEHFDQLTPLFAPYVGILDWPLICPKSKIGCLNHAESMAQSFKKLFSFSGVSTIETPLSGFQKRKKTRFERFQELKSTVMASGNWVFVDDVFVTGATCYKIAEQVGTRPKLALTLFYKEKEF